jgi:MFS family permease
MIDNLIPHNKRGVILSILVASLGYFVDIYDLLLFSIIRVPSLKSIGVTPDKLLDTGAMLIQLQMAGMLIGGLLWGVLGDKRGRLSVLFGSIILYSIANVANGFVQSVEMYGLLRVIAGIGLAGELGAGITLVSEVMPKESRGYGTMIVSAIGILGAVFAALMANWVGDWRTLYFIGGGMGIALLLLRIGVFESGMFEHIKSQQHIKRGNFFSLLTASHKFWKYIQVISIGLPTWYIIGILITFSPEFGTAMGMKEIPDAGKAVMYSYAAISIGDICCAGLSQRFKSRRKAMLTFLLIAAFGLICYFTFASSSLSLFYLVCGILGFGAGFWAVFVTIASEQFGTNIRATVTTTVPNFVRGSLVPITALFQLLKSSLGIEWSAIIVGSLTIILAIWALYHMEETYGKDLNYIEH